MCVHEYLELIGRIMCAFSPISPDLSDFPGDFDPGESDSRSLGQI